MNSFTAPSQTAPNIDTGFTPNADRAMAIDAAIRARLAASLATLFAAICATPALPEAAQTRLLATIRTRPVRPGIMALYGALVPAVVAQNQNETGRILAQLAWPLWHEPASPRVTTLDDSELGPGMAAYYRQHIQDDPEYSAVFTPLSPHILPPSRLRVADACQLLGHAAPALRAEMAALISEVILVDHHAAPGELAFHGASSFFTWGALVLNLAEHRSRVKLLEGLVHEAGHSLLHGFTAGHPMVTNTTAERHISPLREDQRPMEGLVHAAYVLARMHLAMCALQSPALHAAGHITEAEQQEATAKAAAAAASFHAANTTIRRHANFTPTGKAIFASAQIYMNQAFMNPGFMNA
jgi:HEXXH motif-containing protein